MRTIKMEHITLNQPIELVDAQAVVIGIYENGPLEGEAQAVDKATAGLLSALLERNEIRGELFEVTSIYSPRGMRTQLVLTVGLGQRDEFDCGRAYQAAAAAARRLADRPRDAIACFFDGQWSTICKQSCVSGIVVGCHGQDLYRREKTSHAFGCVGWSPPFADVIHQGRILGEAVNATRRLVNQPPHELYPDSFAQAALAIGTEVGLKVEIWDEVRLQAERCGALLAVARGSDRPPRLVLLDYRGGRAEDPVLALVGKGVTFDSGGLSLKPTDNMKTMKGDMAGAATVLGAMQAIARLGTTANVMAVLGLVENMPGGSAFKVGDVLTARNGTTIEIQNTDAEGRLVLADALGVAVDRGPAQIIDLATLTGACIIALGTDVAGLMTNNQPLCDRLAAAARACGELAWQLPMFSIYDKQIKSEVADLKNVGDGRWGGAITAAKFLERFVDNRPWVHIDIAGPSFAEKPLPWLAGGATGSFVRTLVEFVQNQRVASGEWQAASGP
jgi:leucyl aminopeptidase